MSFTELQCPLRENLTHILQRGCRQGDPIALYLFIMQMTRKRSWMALPKLEN